MKFRHYLVVFAGIVLTILVFSISSIATYQPQHYNFLGNSAPKKTTLEPDPVGWVGREARYYVVPIQASEVASEAETELTRVGWKRASENPAVFVRNEHERIVVRGANEYNDKKLLSGIPTAELSNHTVIKVIDPRMSPALRQRFARIARRVQRLQG